MLKLLLKLLNIQFRTVGNGLPILTRGTPRGVIHGLVGVVA